MMNIDFTKQRTLLPETSPDWGVGAVSFLCRGTQFLTPVTKRFNGKQDCRLHELGCFASYHNCLYFSSLNKNNVSLLTGNGRTGIHTR